MMKKKLDIIINMKTNKFQGPDTVHPKLLKELSEVLSYPLSFNKSVEMGKKGDKTYADKYRPVSLTRVVCKVLESVISKRKHS